MPTQEVHAYYAGHWWIVVRQRGERWVLLERDGRAQVVARATIEREMPAPAKIPPLPEPVLCPRCLHWHRTYQWCRR